MKMELLVPSSDALVTLGLVFTLVLSSSEAYNIVDAKTAENCSVQESIKEFSGILEDLKSSLALELEDRKPVKHEVTCSVNLNMLELPSKLEEMKKETNTKIESAIAKLESELWLRLSRMEATLNETRHLVSVYGEKTPCRGGWVYFKGSCYFFGVSRVNWEEGRQECLKMGSDYAKIIDSEEWTFVAEHLTVSSWVGLNDLKEEGNYTWSSDGSAHSDLNPTWWHLDQPDDYLHAEDCIYYLIQGEKIRWNDQECDNKIMGYICEMSSIYT